MIKLLEKDKICFAVVGCGHIGKRHAEMIWRNDEAELVALCDILPKENLKLESFNVPFFSSIDEMLNNDPGIDVVIVATPNGLHAPQAIKSLEAGKHVVVEKPMALSKSDCEEVIHTSMQYSKLVFCVMQNRYSPPSEWLKELVMEKRLGRIFLVQINCFWNRDNRYYQPPDKEEKQRWKGKRDLDGGTLYTQFSHFIDIMYWLFGDIKDIECKFENFNHDGVIEFEDSGFINFKFMKGGMGSINYSTSLWNKNFESSLTIIGEKGTVKVGGQYMNKVEYCDIDDYEMPELEPVNPANDYGPYKGSAANHHYVIDNVVDTLKGRTAIQTNALEGLKVVEIIERIYTTNNFLHNI